MLLIIIRVFVYIFLGVLSSVMCITVLVSIRLFFFYFSHFYPRDFFKIWSEKKNPYANNTHADAPSQSCM